MNRNSLWIGKGYFKGCLSLTNIKLPDNVSLIGESIFENCSSLIEISIPRMAENIPKLDF